MSSLSCWFLPLGVSAKRSATALAVLSTTALAQAADGSWTASSGDWATPGNWAGEIVPGGLGTTGNIDIATFGSGGAGGTIQVEEGRNVGGIVFGTHAYTLSGGPLVLSAGATIFGDTGSLAVQSDVNLVGNANFRARGAATRINISGDITGTAGVGVTHTLTLNGHNANVAQTTSNQISGAISDGANGGKIALSVGGGAVNTTATATPALWELSTANTYSGGTTILAGSRDGRGNLLVTHDNALGTGDVTIYNSSSVGQQGQLQLSGNIDLTLAEGKKIIVTAAGSGANALIENVSGNNSYLGQIQTERHGGFSSSSGKLTLGTIYTTNVNTGGAAFTLGGAGDGEVVGRIYNTDDSGGGARRINLTKNGTGTWTLSNPGTGTERNRFKSIVVTAGELLLNSDNSLNVGVVTVSASGTLGGNGIVGGTGATFAAGSFLSAGPTLAEDATGVGTFTFTSAVDISGLAGGTDGGLLFQLGSLAASDKVALTTGALTIGTLDLADFDFTALTGFGTGTYTLFDTSQTVVGSFGTNLTGTLDGYDITLAFANANQDIVLIVSAIPEPSAYAVILGSLILAGVVARRRRR